MELFGPDWERLGGEPQPPRSEAKHPEAIPMQSITCYLTADHARLHELLQRATRGQQLDQQAFAAFRAGLLRHIGIEEKVLFPAVRAALGGIRLDGTLELRVDHAAIASLLVPTPDLALAHELAGLLERHDAVEERPEGVYEQCENILGEIRALALGRQAQDAPEVPVAPHYDGPNVHRSAKAALDAARRASHRRAAGPRSK